MRHPKPYSKYVGKNNISGIEHWECWLGSKGCYQALLVDGEVVSILTGARRHIVSASTMTKLMPLVKLALANPVGIKQELV